MTGDGELTALTIAPAAVDPDDLETLQDLVVAAVRDASGPSTSWRPSTMGPLAGGLGGGRAAASACPASDRRQPG